MGNVLTSKGFQLQPDILGSIQGGLNLANQFKASRAAEQQLGQQQANQGLARNILGPQQGRDPGVQSADIDELFSTDPDFAKKIINQVGIRNKKEIDLFGSIGDIIQKTEPGQLQGTVSSIINNMRRSNASPNLIRSMEEFQQKTPQEQLNGARVMSGLARHQGSQAGPSAKTREFNNLLRVAQDPDSTELEKNSARRALGDLAKVSTTVQERLADDPDLSKKVADSQAGIIGAKEEAKLGAQLKFKPQINKAVKLAEKEAAERGEVLTDLARMKAAKPGLDQVVENLRELSSIATSTIAGKIFDVGSKELGFGSTKGANARAKFIAIVNNQVLPLLKPTFGAAFTVPEGEALKATMGDPDASPAEKMAQLDAFIEQKVRDIETKEAQLNQPQDINTLSDDDLLSF